MIGQSNGMLIAQITDIHIGFDRGNPEERNMARLRAVLARMIDGPNRPDMLLMSGDLTEYGDAESYALLAEAVSTCPFPVYPMAGNHDARGTLLDAFPDAPSQDGFIHYVIEGDGLRLIVLDTLEPGRHGGGFCEVRAAWFKSQLAEAPTTPTLVAMHHPPFESGIAWLDGSDDEPWMARFAACVAGRSNVVGILCGHLHRTIHTLWYGHAITVCPSTAPAVGLDLRPVDPQAPDGRAMITDELPGYALHRWDGGRLVSHFESAGPIRTLARYDAKFQEVVRTVCAERPGG